MSDMAIKQLREKIQKVVIPGQSKDDLLVMVEWVEDSIKRYKNTNDSLRKNMAWHRKYIAEKTEECGRLESQVEELEAEIEGNG